MLKFQKSSHGFQKAQTAVEYLILLAMVVAIVLIGFRTLLPKAQVNTQGFYNKAAVGIMGRAPHCGDGICNGFQMENPEECVVDCPPAIP